MSKQRTVETDTLFTLIRRAPALAALREQPLDRRDLEACLDLSKPTIHRLTHTLGEEGLVKRSDGVVVLTGLGEAVADVVAEFKRTIETTYRLTPLLETLQDRYPDVDIEAFADATVTTAGPDDPYRPVRRYRSLVEETGMLFEFGTTALSFQHADVVHRQVRDGMEAALVSPPTVAARFVAAHPDQTAESIESGRLVLRVHDDISHGIVIFDDRVGIASYCETTGTLQVFVDTDSVAAREWAEAVYESHWAEADPLDALEAGPELTLALH